MTTNPPDRLDQIAALLRETVQITRSNAERSRLIAVPLPTQTLLLHLPIRKLRDWCKL